MAEKDPQAPLSASSQEQAPDVVAAPAVASQGPDAASQPSKVRLAVFDFDGTLINAQSGTQFTKFLFTHGLIGPLTTAKVILWGARYALHLPHDQDAVRGYLIDDLAHHTRDEVLQIMDRCHDEVLTQYYRADGLRQVQQCRDDGCVCLLVSATFWGIARAACAYAGLDDFLATRMETDAQGRFTGRVLGSVIEGPQKPRAIEAWANERYGEGGWTLEYAFGDHHSDEPLLAAAERPFAVNPGQTLSRVAKRHGWPILEWQ